MAKNNNWSTYQNIDKQIAGQLSDSGNLGTSSYGSNQLENAAQAKTFAGNQSQIDALTQTASDNLKAATSFRRGAEDSVFGGDYASKAGIYEQKYKANKAALDRLSASNATMGNNPLIAGVSNQAIEQNNATLDKLSTGEKNISSGGTVWSRTITPLLESVALGAVGGLGGLLKTAGDVTGIGAALGNAGAAVMDFAKPAIDTYNTAIKPVNDIVTGLKNTADTLGTTVNNAVEPIMGPVNHARQMNDFKGSPAVDPQTVNNALNNAPVPKAEIGPLGQMIDNLANRISHFPAEDVLTRIAFGEDPKVAIKEGLAQAKQDAMYAEAMKNNPDAAIDRVIKNSRGESITISSKTNQVDQETNSVIPNYDNTNVQQITQMGGKVVPLKDKPLPEGTTLGTFKGIGRVAITFPQAPEFKPGLGTAFTPNVIPSKKQEAAYILNNGVKVYGAVDQSVIPSFTGASDKTFIEKAYDSATQLQPNQVWGTRNGKPGIITTKLSISGNKGNGEVKLNTTVAKFNSKIASKLNTDITTAAQVKQELVKLGATASEIKIAAPYFIGQLNKADNFFGDVPVITRPGGKK